MAEEQHVLTETPEEIAYECVPPRARCGRAVGSLRALRCSPWRHSPSRTSTFVRVTTLNCGAPAA